MILRRIQGIRIDDVMIALTVHDEIALIITGGDEGAAIEVADDRVLVAGLAVAVFRTLHRADPLRAIAFDTDRTHITAEVQEEAFRTLVLNQLCSILIQLQSFTPPIVHRDIKPSNIILTEDGRIVLIDLNAARLDDKNRSHDTQLIGTAGFAAPEQYGFAASSPRADLYAAGILMRVLLTGTDAKDDVLSRHLSRKMRAIIERCTQLDPRKRYPSAQALQRDIRKLMHKEMKGISCS